MATRPDLIYCAASGKDFARVAVDDCGWLYGARLPGTTSRPLHFADQDWKSPDRTAYVAALARHRPAIATVLDWEQEDQLDEVLSWAVEAARYVGRVVIIPKIPGRLSCIPERIGGAEVVLGYSVPTSYGASPVPLWEFGRRPVHLLGGSPHRQREIAGYLNVVSLDGSMAAQQARKGRTWCRRRGPKGHWHQLADLGDDRTEEVYLEAFRRSLDAIRQIWTP